MNKIEEILSIDDRKERQAELVKFAKSLGGDSYSCQDQTGQWIEEKLVIQIYDGLQKKKKNKKSDFNFIGIGIAVGVVMIALISFLPRLLVSFYESEQEKEESKGKMLQGFTEDGKPAFENGKPVLFKSMEGSYEEYDKEGNLVAEHYYEGGSLVRTIKFDLNGKVIKEEVFSE